MMTWNCFLYVSALTFSTDYQFLPLQGLPGLKGDKGDKGDSVSKIV